MLDVRFSTRRGVLLGLGAFALIPGLAAAQDAGTAGEPQMFVDEGVYGYGDPDAPVTVIEYVSLTCPHCARFHETAYQDLKRDYLDTGKAKLIFREVYFDRLGLWGAMLARCGGDAKYFGFVDLLLRRQESWVSAEDIGAEFRKLGRLGGLTDEEVDACLSDQDKARELVEMYQGYRDDPRLTGTPTLIVGENKVENPTAERLSAAIEAELAK